MFTYLKIKFLFPKNYKHGLLGNDFYTETIEIKDDINLYKRFDFDGFINKTFKRTSIWNKLNHFSFKPYLKWKRIFKDDDTLDYDLFIYQATSMIKVIYNNYELNYLHNPTFKEVILDFYLVHGINIKIKRKDISIELDDHVISFDSINSFEYLSGDYCIDISDYEKIPEIKADINSIENPFEQ